MQSYVKSGKHHKDPINNLLFLQGNWRSLKIGIGLEEWNRFNMWDAVQKPVVAGYVARNVSTKVNSDKVIKSCSKVNSAQS